MINVLLATLVEVVKAHEDLVTGNAAKEDLVEAKKRFSQALNEYIDYRVDLAFDRRRKSMSQERIATADSINAGVKSMASAVKSIAALNSAPPPPEDHNEEEMEKWKIAYQKWYENQRKSGMSIG